MINEHPVFRGNVLYSTATEHALCHMPADTYNSVSVIILWRVMMQQRTAA